MKIASESLVFVLNIFFVVSYMVTSIFADGNGMLLGLNSVVSNIIIYGLLIGGIGLAVFSLIKNLKKWIVPVVCLGIYLIFLL